MENIIKDKPTEAAKLILARIGQGVFRERVIETWGHSLCAATSSPIKSIFTASHIVPWRECTGKDEWQRLDGANGILLCAHIDRLFDRHLISFEPGRSGCKVKISTSIDIKALEQLGVTNDLELVANMMSPDDRDRFLGYIEKHYEIFLEKNE